MSQANNSPIRQGKSTSRATVAFGDAEGLQAPHTLAASKNGSDWLARLLFQPAPVQLAEQDDYLIHEYDGTVFPAIEVNPHGHHSADVRLNRRQADLWLTSQKGAFTNSIKLSAAEARLIGEALVKAAEDAEEFARQVQTEQDWLDDEAHDRDMEMDLVREAETRGEEYVPYAIGAEHMNFIEMAVLHGEPLKPWQQELAPDVRLCLHKHDGGSIDLKQSAGCFNAWFRWHAAAHPLAHVLSVRHTPTNTSTNYTATTDDFGSLVIVPDRLECVPCAE